MPTNTPNNPTKTIRELASRWPSERSEQPLYRIRRWNDHFETGDSRKYARLHYVRVPNKHDGKGYGRLCALPNAPEIFAAFVLIVELASKAPARGWLADEDGPYTAEDMGFMTRMPAAIFERAMPLLSTDQIDWLERVPPENLSHPENLLLNAIPTGDSPGTAPVTGRNPEIHREAGRKREMPGESPAQIREEKIRSNKRREVPPTVPQGGQRKEGDFIASAAVPSEKRGPEPHALAIEWAGNIAELFGRSRERITSAMLAHLEAHARAGFLPVDPGGWVAIRRMHAQRKKDGIGEDKRLGCAWLESADKLAEKLPEATDRAEMWFRDTFGTAPKVSAKNSEPDPDPPGWREWFANEYPKADQNLRFHDIPADIRELFHKDRRASGPVNWRQIATELFPRVEIPSNWEDLPSHARERILMAKHA